MRSIEPLRTEEGPQNGTWSYYSVPLFTCPSRLRRLRIFRLGAVGESLHCARTARYF